MTRLIEQLMRLPGIGEKTAARLAFHILRADRPYARALAEAVLAIKEETRLCSVCFALTEADPCPVCTDPARLPDAICVVEEPADLLAVERPRGPPGDVGRPPPSRPTGFGGIGAAQRAGAREQRTGPRTSLTSAAVCDPRRFRL